MLRRAKAAPAAAAEKESSPTAQQHQSHASSAEDAGIFNNAAAYLKSLEDPEVIERVRCSIPDAHVFKLPTRQTAGGWRGADWTQEVWQGTLKVVERGPLTVILLVEKTNGSIFAVCPVKDGAVDRCVDSSRYFVLRVENEQGRHMYIGLAFNERNDAFDFNTSLEDSRREKEIEANPGLGLETDGPAKDYSIKEGEKLKISVPKAAAKRRPARRASDGCAPGGGGFLKPSSKDTPKRAPGEG